MSNGFDISIITAHKLGLVTVSRTSGYIIIFNEIQMAKTKRFLGMYRKQT